MATDRNMSSVLAKLMGIDKPSTSRTMHKRHRVFSENYHQNIAAVGTREKAYMYSDDSVSNMDESEYAVEVSARTSVTDYQGLVHRNEKSFLGGRSFSQSSSSSGDWKRKMYVCEGNSSGIQLQRRRMNSSCRSIQTPVRGSLSSQEVAKQITGQVKHSIWHSCAELSRSRPIGEKSSVDVMFESKKKHDDLCFDPVKGSTSRGIQKPRKQLSERWRTRKYSLDLRTSCGSKIQDEVLVKSSKGSNSVINSSDGSFNTLFFTARYLSKPARFPSAWVPRTKARHFTFDKSWCLKPGKWDSKQCNESQGNIRCKDVQSSSEPISLVSQSPCIHQASLLILNDSVKLAEQNSSEETFTATESSSIGSSFSDVGSPTYHEAYPIPNETEGRHLLKDVLGSTVESLPSSCNFAASWETEEAIDSSAKSTTCILVGDKESWKHQSKNKNNASEPRSPVSSLEGPEACRHVPKLTVEVAEYLSVSENSSPGMQRKFQLIDTMSLESGSEGPEMVVSSEGDDEGSLGLYQNDPQLMEIYQTLRRESCDYSYVVDVVEESGLHLMDFEMERKRWCLQGYVLEPMVFEMLEKRYGKHDMPWEKSERRLLFDRLNSGLLEIVKPSVGLDTWKKPVAERFCPRQKSQELIEEELWSLLVKQEQKFKKFPYDKLCINEMEWLDLEEDTDLIAQEIQSLLVEELIEEFVCG